METLKKVHADTLFECQLMQLSILTTESRMESWNKVFVFRTFQFLSACTILTSFSSIPRFFSSLRNLISLTFILVMIHTLTFFCFINFEPKIKLKDTFISNSIKLSLARYHTKLLQNSKFFNEFKRTSSTRVRQSLLSNYI